MHISGIFIISLVIDFQRKIETIFKILDSVQ